jgi:hypothetical protein
LESVQRTKRERTGDKMIGNLLSDQPITPKRTTSMVPPGMGDLNYLQSLIAGITNQELNTTSSPTWVGGTFTGLTASLPIVTNASKALASVSYATFKASLAIAQADVSGLTTASSPTFAGLTLTAFSGFVKAAAGVLSAGSIAAGDLPAHVLDGAIHTVSGLTGGHFLKATGATTFGFAAHGLTYSDVGAEANGAVSTHNSSASAHGFTTAGKALANLANPSAITFPRVNADNTATLLSASDFRTAIGAGTSSFDGAYSSLSGKPALGTASAQDVGYFDLAGVASGAVAAHAALITGVHGLIFTAGKALTLQKSMTLTAADDTGVYTFPTGTKTLLATTGSPAALVIASQATGDLLYASSATAWSRLALGAAGKALVVNAGGTLPEWGTVLTNPMDAAGQLIYGGAAGAPTKLAAGATTDILVGGGAAAPVWTAATGTGVPVRAGSPTFTGVLTTPQLSIPKSSTYNSEGTYGLYIADPTNDTGVQFGADITLHASFIQSMDPGTSYTTRPLLLQPNGGYVGVGGVSAPNAPLSVMVAAGASETVALSLYPSTSGGLPAYSFGMGPTNTEGFVSYRSGTGSSATFGHKFLVNNVEIMRIDGNGRVGIKSTAPKSPLQVIGLTNYASDALAAAAGLTSGAFYRHDFGGVGYVCAVP